MMAAVEQMPEDWDETELQWILVRRARLFSEHHFVNPIRRKAFENAAGTTGCDRAAIVMGKERRSLEPGL
jgi:hypothetical protein